jgi:hypothetical protein
MGIAAIAATQFAAAVASGMADASVAAELKKKGMSVTTAPAVFDTTGQVMAIPTTGDVHDLFGLKAEAKRNAQANSIFNITVTSADPKAVVDAIAKYVKANGALPSGLVTGKYRR